MYFYLPTKIYHERDCVRKYAPQWTALGSSALIVTGKSSAKNGSLQDVTDALKEAGKAYIIFDETEENPSTDQIMQVRDLGLEAKADFVIGVGGGSPMDAAKAVALMMANPDKDADFLYAKGTATGVAANGTAANRAAANGAEANGTAATGAAANGTAAGRAAGGATATRQPALPVVEVPTTCGTGSEATPYAILLNRAKRMKASLPHRIYPAYALVDGKYLTSASRNILVNTAIDALGHYIESYINTNATPYSRMLCEYGLGVWASVKDVLAGAKPLSQECEQLTPAAGSAAKERKDLTPAAESTAKEKKQLAPAAGPTPEECDRLMLAATIAGMAISHTGTALPHGLSYYLTCGKQVPHGRAVGYFLPGYLAQADPRIAQKVLNLAGFPDLQAFRLFLDGLIGRAEAEDALIDAAVSGLLSNQTKLKNVPFPVTEAVLRTICETAR